MDIEGWARAVMAVLAVIVATGVLVMLVGPLIGPGTLRLDLPIGAGILGGTK